MSTDGLIDVNQIIKYVNETNVNTKCVARLSYAHHAYVVIIPTYPLRAAIAAYMEYRFLATHWAIVVHCMNMGAYIESGGYALADLIANAKNGEFKRLLELSKQHKQRFDIKTKKGILRRMRTKIVHFREPITVLRYGESADKLVKAGEELIRCGARIYIEWTDITEWHNMLVTAERSRSVATTCIGMYKRSKWAIPKDILIMIAKMVYERRFEIC